MGKAKPNRIRVLRAERRLTQIALYLKTKIQPARISQLENCYYVAKPEERERLARAFKVAVSDVFPNDVPAPPAATATESTPAEA